MAMYPCDVGAHRYRSAQQTMYPAVVDGELSARRKLRLCPPHFDGYLEKLHELAQNAQIEFEQAAEVTCYMCGQPVLDDAAQLFVTVYAANSERADWWAPLHRACSEAAMEDWLLTASIDS